MNYNVQYYPASHKDLDDILDFCNHFKDIDVAKRVISEIIEKMESLSFYARRYNFDERIEKKIK